jgi:hypothetical protein
MDSRKILTPDFKNHCRPVVSDRLCCPDVDADTSDTSGPEHHCSTGKAAKQANVIVALEMRDPGDARVGVRIRESAITPGKILRTLEEMIAIRRRSRR